MRFPVIVSLGALALMSSGVAACAGQTAGSGRPGHASGWGGGRPKAPARRRRPPESRAAGDPQTARLAFSRASNQVVQAQPAPGSCHARGRGVYSRPDPHCTPGALNPEVRQANIHQTICVTGWTATVRPPEAVTETEKRASLQAYGDSGPLSSYEYDHLVPLELGGATNDPGNLWPEPGPSPDPKDAVELHLRDRVCSGAMMLARAQRQIASDWVRFAAGEARHLEDSAGSPPHCRARAVYDPAHGDFDVYVSSNRPEETVTVAGDGRIRTWHTDSRGLADVYFPAASGSRGKLVTARVGGARCGTSL